MTRRAGLADLGAALRHHLVPAAPSTNTATCSAKCSSPRSSSSCSRSSSPLFFQVVIDKVLVHRSLSTLDVLVIGLVTISVFESVLGDLRTYLFSHTTNRIDVELGARLFRHLLALPIAYFQARRVGDSVARVRELENIRNFLTSSALTLVIDLFFTFVFLAVMFIYSPLLTCIVLGVVSVLYRHFGRRDAAVPQPARREVRPRRREPGLSGGERHRRRDAEGDGGRAADAAALGGAARRLRARRASACSSLGNTASQSVQLVNKLVTAGILYFGAKLVIDGRLTVGELVAFNMLAGRVSAAGVAACADLAGFSSGAALDGPAGRYSQHRARAALQPGARGAAGDSRRRHIRARDLPLPHRRRRRCCTTLAFNVPAGQVIGIVGPSGSGKSTLAKLVQRLYVPESGRVLVDGVDLAMVDAAWLRRQVGVVLQENVLFNRSIRDNIALADPAHADRAGHRGGQARRRARIHPGAAARATTRSSASAARACPGGQRQRIAIARALVINPRILIFDEATSALDYESERIIQENMQRIAQGRTVFIIAHRLSTVRRSDRIITIDRGRLVEDGTHEELIKTGGAMHRCTACRRGSMKSVRKIIRISAQDEPARARTSSPFCRPRSRSSRRRRRRPAASSPAPSCAVSARAHLGMLRRVDIVATATGKIIPSGRPRSSSRSRPASSVPSTLQTGSRSRPARC